DFHVTGVQTCALPICRFSCRIEMDSLPAASRVPKEHLDHYPRIRQTRLVRWTAEHGAPAAVAVPAGTAGTAGSGPAFVAGGRPRSEERRLGKEMWCAS